ncbi:hypothetical protein CEXT_260431 [Caerostris extrusa]|uniref:Uncharacterized protein n=1 Tax=Caerostris extrusa TaxID=172846 RepID=A0AAV4UFB9_CAEEX|nr:hypothetical protein CEXT_260431 [Caerostris extrusa]
MSQNELGKRILTNFLKLEHSHCNPLIEIRFKNSTQHNGFIFPGLFGFHPISLPTDLKHEKKPRDLLFFLTTPQVYFVLLFVGSGSLRSRIGVPLKIISSSSVCRLACGSRSLCRIVQPSGAMGWKWNKIGGLFVGRERASV